MTSGTVIENPRGTFVRGHKTLADMSTVPITEEEAEQYMEAAGLNGPFAQVPVVQLQFIYDYLKRIGALTRTSVQDWVDMPEAEQNLRSKVNGEADMAALLLSGYLPRKPKVPLPGSAPE